MTVAIGCSIAVGSGIPGGVGLGRRTVIIAGGLGVCRAIGIAGRVELRRAIWIAGRLDLALAKRSGHRRRGSAA